MTIFGTRPEAIKMAPVIKELERFRDEIQSVCVVTAQHREMLDQVLSLFAITPDSDLNIMEENQTLSGITVRALQGLEGVFANDRPDLVLVQGDTTTAFAAALAAFYGRIAVGHVEAGLRTDDKYNPYPEEINRRLITTLGDLHFAPTTLAKQHLLANGVEAGRIYLTGNTVTDALHHILAHSGEQAPFPWEGSGRRVLFVETHRRENFGAPMEEICRALKKIVENFTDTEIVFSVHKNPKVREPVYRILQGVDRVRLLEPMDYPTLVRAMKSAAFILTDSGGIQEEAPSLGKPVLVLRTTTERPEGIEAGTARLVGTTQGDIVKEASRLLTDAQAYRAMSHQANPYGDGEAARRIVGIIRHHFGLAAVLPEEFVPRSGALAGS